MFLYLKYTSLIVFVDMCTSICMYDIVTLKYILCSFMLRLSKKGMTWSWFEYRILSELSFTHVIAEINNYIVELSFMDGVWKIRWKSMSTGVTPISGNHHIKVLVKECLAVNYCISWKSPRMNLDILKHYKIAHNSQLVKMEDTWKLFYT